LQAFNKRLHAILRPITKRRWFLVTQNSIIVSNACDVSSAAFNEVHSSEYGLILH